MSGRVMRRSLLAAVGAAAIFISAGAFAHTDSDGAGVALPTPVPLVVDVDGIIQQCKAGHDVIVQIKIQQQAYEKQLSKREDELRQEQDDLQKQQTTLSPDVLEQKRRDFDQRVQKFRDDAQQKQQALGQASDAAQNKIVAKLNLIVTKIANERHANLVLLKSQLALYATDYDITAEALAQLDAQFPTLKIVIPKLPQAPPGGAGYGGDDYSQAKQ